MSYITNDNLQHVHFIGIGGIGMSALAIILKQRGYNVSGSDCNLKQKSIVQLKELGCILHHDAEQQDLPATTTLVVYSAAVAQTHPELQQARARTVPIATRAQLLAYLFNQQIGIAIAGAHGKTTTSSLAAHVFMHAEKDPTFAIGGHLHNYHTNAHAGTGKYFIAETCENDHTITLVRPSITILTNVDREHLDIYKDLDEIKAAFTCYLNNTKPDGTIIVCHDDTHTMSLIPQLPEHLQKRVISYGFSPQADIYIAEHTLFHNYSTATAYYNNKQSHTPELIGTFTLTIPGKHNLLNALAVLAAARIADISFATFAQACATFQGIDRRFTYKGTYKDTLLFDDYGHHPTEIENILPVAYKRAQHEQGRLVVVFQPHRYSRTQKLWQEFIEVLSKASFEILIITDIYPAFEQPIDTISSQRLACELQQAAPKKTILYVPETHQFSSIHTTLDDIIKPRDLIFFLGAGKVNQLADLITENKNN